MTPKEKALFMLALFQTIHHPTIDCDNMFAKECAKRAIDVIIENCQVGRLRYWHAVKKELEAL